MDVTNHLLQSKGIIWVVILVHRSKLQNDSFALNFEAFHFLKIMRKKLD